MPPVPILAAVVLLLLWASSARAHVADTAIFAGGAFSCLEEDMNRVVGVMASDAGYIGGFVPEPTFEDVTAQKTGHYMAVRVQFDPARVRYEDLLIAYLLTIDPTDDDGQFCERGASFRPAIFVLDDRQRAAAEGLKARLERLLGQPLSVTVLPATVFWPAEERHQDFAAKNPLRFEFYRRSCGRDQGLKAFWGRVPMLASQP